ncbi:MAG TPA: phosphoadenylyl-sulfate reductase [Rhizomicrobium sp.]|jgi:phosphoadenosine phosphosulfate reductase
MLLTDSGEIAADRFVPISGDVALPSEGAILLDGARYLAEAESLAERAPAVGVAWPNSRDVSLLAPHLGGLALIALDFPNFRDGRAYSQARRLREQFGYRGELRATGDVLRDQFLFMLRSGFDSFDVRKPGDAPFFMEAVRRYSVRYQSTSDGGITAAGLRIERRTTRMPGRPLAALDAATLDRQLADAEPAEVVAQALRLVPGGKLAIVSSFGIESAALLKIVADVSRSLPVIFLDTEWLFDETLAYRDALIAHLGLTDVRTIRPSPAAANREDPDFDLWARNPEGCCHLRKVAPLAEALAPFKAWISGRKRFHGGQRALMPVVESDGDRLKFNPLARVSPRAIAAIFRSARLPKHPLAARGFASVGCIPCTTSVSEREGVRAGRWRGTGRSECGIHTEIPGHDGHLPPTPAGQSGA